MRSREVFGSASFTGDTREDVVATINKAIDGLVLDAGEHPILWDTIEISTDNSLQEVRTLVEATPRVERWTRFDVRALAVVSETEEPE
jgi:predicted RNase H-like HicB family nuclease